VTQICLPLLDVHQGVEVFLYANAAGGQVEDSQALAARLAARGQHFVPIQNLTDEQAAARIREDGIDILVDLSGHAAPNRMLVFARKPAPIQLSWLGYPGNTGLAAIDFRLTDAIADPPGDGERTNGERLLRIERSSLCYVAPEAAGSVAERRASRAGEVTFGSFTSVAKLSPATIALWARLLRECRYRACSSRRRNSGIAPRANGWRLHSSRAASQWKGWISLRRRRRRNRLSRYANVDIGLDPFPWNGLAASLEQLWMGVPLVTLRGERPAARIGASILTAIGLRPLIADRPDDYVEVAAGLARDPDLLARLRGGLRDRMRVLPLCDIEAFASALEASYRATGVRSGTIQCTRLLPARRIIACAPQG